MDDLANTHAHEKKKSFIEKNFCSENTFSNKLKENQKKRNRIVNNM